MSFYDGATHQILKIAQLQLRLMLIGGDPYVSREDLLDYAKDTFDRGCAMVNLPESKYEVYYVILS